MLEMTEWTMTAENKFYRSRALRPSLLLLMIYIFALSPSFAFANEVLERMSPARICQQLWIFSTMLLE